MAPLFMSEGDYRSVELQGAPVTVCWLVSWGWATIGSCMSVGVSTGCGCCCDARQTCTVQYASSLHAYVWVGTTVSFVIRISIIYRFHILFTVVCTSSSCVPTLIQYISPPLLYLISPLSSTCARFLLPSYLYFPHPVHLRTYMDHLLYNLVVCCVLHLSCVPCPLSSPVHLLPLPPAHPASDPLHRKGRVR